MRRILVLLAACALTLPGADALPALLTHASAAAAQVSAMRIAFTQEKHLAILDEPLTSSGFMEIDRTASAMRWEFTGKAVLIFAHGDLRRWGVDGSREDLGSNPSLQAIAQQMHALVSGDWSPLLVLFTAEEDTAANAVVFRPKSADLLRYVTSMRFVFRPDGSPAAMTLDSPGGDRTDYHFDVPDLTWKPTPARFAGP
jgi:hypothetical protein